MKRLMAFMFAIVFTTGLFCAPVLTYAATYDWTDGYYDLLINRTSNTNYNMNNMTKFALYDTDSNGVPELILKNTRLEGNYQIYSYKDSQTKLDRNLSASTFHVTKDDKLVVAYGDVAGTTYVYYDPEKNISTSEVLLRSKRTAQDSAGEWQWVYTYKGKEVSQKEYEKLLAENISNIGLVFSDINEENLSNELFIGLGFPSYSEMAYFAGDRNNAGTNINLNFANGESAAAVKNGQNMIYGLLLVNGIFSSDTFPINVNGNTMVPVRSVGTNLDANVSWVGDLQKIVVEKGSRKIEMFVDESHAFINGEEVKLDAAPVLIDGITYVPLRFVSQSLDTDVYFTEANNNFLPIISIESKASESYNEFDEYAALSKARFIIKSIDWTNDRNVFSRSHMDDKISIRSEGLVHGRYWSIVVDTNNSQRLLFDKYTGHVFSQYSYSNEFGIKAGVDSVIDAMVAIYAY